MFIQLSAVSVALEVEPQLEDVVVELASESSLVAVLPLLVHYLEGNVLVRWTRRNPQNHKLAIWSWRHLESRRLPLVDQVRIEDIEFVTLKREWIEILVTRYCTKFLTCTILGGGLSKS